MFLAFDITDQILTRTDENRVVTDSVDYLKAKFSFLSDEWTDTIKSAIFRAGDKCYTVLLDVNNECTVPHEVLKQSSSGFVNLKVSVFGVNGTVRITTNSKTIRLDVSGYVAGETPEDPTPDIYNILVAGITSAINKADVADDILEDYYNGLNQMIDESEVIGSDYRDELERMIDESEVLT